MKSHIVKKSLLLSVLFFWILLVTGQDNMYDVSKIPLQLLKNANAVMRNYNAVFEIDDIDNASVKVNYAITILNKSALEQSYFIQFYNKFIKVRNISAMVYDEYGDPIKNNRVKHEDIKDYSAITGYTLYDDNRVKFIDPEIKVFPFTVEYSYQVNFKGLLNYPKWQLFEEYNISVEKSTFKIIVPKDFKFRYLERNNPPKVKIIHNEEDNVYTWDTSNVCPIVQEQFSPSLRDQSPMVYLAPNDFKIGGYEGNCESWENFGKWISLLNEGQDILPEEAEIEIKAVVEGINDEYEKAKLLYEYMQNKTRYVSVQIGIGGWQTIDAETVYRLGYGDCKALSNFMKSIFEVAGIKSYYTLVYAGRNTSDIISTFPSNQFNHVILCIPINNDTVWLECTNQNIPFGYIGSFTEDRDVLIINENGGNLVRSKSYDKDVNRQLRSAVININQEGHSDAVVKTRYNGMLYDDMIGIIRSDAIDQKKLMYKKINIPNFEIIEFNHNEKKEIIPYIDENLVLKLDNYAVSFGNRLMVDLNLMNKIKLYPDEDEVRTSDILLQRSLIEIDTIIYKLPEGYIVEDIPQNKTFDSPFGKYSFSVKNDKDSVIYIRYLAVNKGVYPKEAYQDFLAFYNEIVAADKYKFVLKME